MAITMSVRSGGGAKRAFVLPPRNWE